ncbi:MAG: cell division protein FtsQ/DivIB [Desulfomonilaceae bacterium]
MQILGRKYRRGRRVPLKGADPLYDRQRNRRILKGILAVTLTADCLLFAAFVALLLVYLPYFNLREVEVVGNRRLSRAEVVEASGMESGINLLTVDLRAIAERLRRHPWVRSAAVYRRFPGRIVLEIEERTPRAILAANKLYYVDEQAEFFTRLLPGDPVHLPLFTGVKEEDLRVSGGEIKEMLRNGLRLIDYMDKGSSGLDIADVSHLRIRVEEGLSLYTRSGQVIILGKTDLEQKMERYGRLKKFLTQRGEWHNARVINLDFEDRALVRSADKARLQG